MCILRYLVFSEVSVDFVRMTLTTIYNMHTKYYALICVEHETLSFSGLYEAGTETRRTKLQQGTYWGVALTFGDAFNSNVFSEPIWSFPGSILQMATIFSSLGPRI